MPCCCRLQILSSTNTMGFALKPLNFVMFVVLHEEHSVTPVFSAVLSYLKLGVSSSDKCRHRKIQVFLFCHGGPQKSSHSIIQFSPSFQDKTRQWGLTLNSRTSCFMFKHLHSNTTIMCWKHFLLWLMYSG